MRQTAQAADIELRVTAIHEAGHCVVGAAVGMSPRVVSIRRGEAHVGVAIVNFVPFPEVGIDDVDVLYPMMREEFRRPLETKIMFAVAGHEAEKLYAPRQEGWQDARPTEDEIEAYEHAGTVLSLDQAKDLADAEARTERDSDPVRAQRLASIAVGRELVSSYTFFMESLTAHLLSRPWHRAQVLAIADELVEKTVLPGERVQELLNEAGGN